MDREQKGINANDNARVWIENLVQNFAPPELRDRSEAKLLQAVKNEVAGRLAQSLHNRVYIELDKAEDNSKVEPLWSGLVKLGDAQSQRCPQGTSIVEIFDRPEIGGRLLVLGAPGSGKTTMLLQLAEELVKRATENAACSVPVLLNLSAWKAEFKDISSWMIADLKLKYGVRKDIAQKWIDEGRILPLLDGLDELMSQRQETCVRALNAFLPNWSGIPLVVCSRLEEYQIYESNLGLNGAVILQSLTDEQIEKFFRAAKCDWFWEAVCNDADVMTESTGLARSPLFLMLLVLASDELSVDLWQQKGSLEERRRILFEAYITAQLKRPYSYLGRAKLPERTKVKKFYWNDTKIQVCLGWLATYLIKENRTEFFIENLKPLYLETRWQKFVFGLVFGLFGVSVLWTILSLALWIALVLIFDSVSELVLGLVLWLIFGLIFGLVAGLVYGSAHSLGYGVEEIKTVETIQFPRITPINFWSLLVSGLLSGLIFWLLSRQIFWLAFGLVIALVYGLVESLKGAEVEVRRSDNQGIYQSIINGAILGLLLLPFGMLFPLAMPDISESITFGLLLALGPTLGFLFGALNGGLWSAIEHFGLRITLWLFGYSPWNYSKFLRYCTDRGFLQRVGGGYRFVHALLRDHFATEYGNLKDNNSQEK